MKQEKPCVSVVMPTYNQERYVLEAIESILGQDYPNIELIVVNDGSTDSTGDILKAYLREHGEKFVYITQQNGGVAKALSAGFNAAKGKYFIEHPSDDIMIAGNVRKRVECIEANPDFDCIFADAYVMRENEKIDRPVVMAGKKPPHLSSEHTLEDFIKGRTRIVMTTGIFNMDRLRALGGIDDGFRTEDIYLRYLLVRRAKIGFLNEPVLYYRMHATNTSKLKPFWIRRDKVKAFEKLLAEEELESNRKVIRNQLFLECMKFLRDGMNGAADKSELLSVSKRALALKPWSLRALFRRGRLCFS